MAMGMNNCLANTMQKCLCVHSIFQIFYNSIVNLIHRVRCLHYISVLFNWSVITQFHVCVMPKFCFCLQHYCDLLIVAHVKNDEYHV